MYIYCIEIVDKESACSYSLFLPFSGEVGPSTSVKTPERSCCIYHFGDTWKMHIAHDSSSSSTDRVVKSGLPQ